MPYISKKKMYKKKNTYKRKYSPKKSMVALIKKTISRQTEDKQSVVQLDNVAFNSGINSSGDVNILVNTISQGADNGQRIGHTIRGKSLRVKGHLQLSAIPTSSVQGQQGSGVISANCRVAVRIMMVEPKSYKFPTVATSQYSSWIPYLLSNGVADSQFNGNTKDLYLDINRDVVKVYYDKVHYLNISQQYINTLTGDSVVPMTGSVKFFVKNILLKNKLIQFSDYSDQPTNFSPVILAGYAHIDGSTPDTITTAINVSYVSKLTYEDA